MSLVLACLCMVWHHWHCKMKIWNVKDMIWGMIIMKGVSASMLLRDSMTKTVMLARRLSIAKPARRKVPLNMRRLMTKIMKIFMKAQALFQTNGKVIWFVLMLRFMRSGPNIGLEFHLMRQSLILPGFPQKP